MKHLWLWLVFILAYGLLSMKSHATVLAARSAEAMTPSLSLQIR